MECNIGKIERIVRAVFGLFFIWIGTLFGFWWYLLAAYMLLTAIAGFCPLYKIVGVNTCKKPETEEEKKAKEQNDSDSEKDAFNTAADHISSQSSDDGPSIESWKAPEEKDKK